MIAPDWSRFHHAPKHLDGSSADWRTARPAETRADKRARDRKFKKALRNYRRNVRPMADEPHSLLDSWLFLLPLGLMCIGVLLWQAGVFK